jgi:hypothetical protein
VTPEPAARGVVFPDEGESGASSRRTGARIVAAALRRLDVQHAEAALREPRWRHNYPQHFRRLVRGAMRSPEAALASCRAGLDEAWRSMQWADADGRHALAEALHRPAAPLHAATFEGRGDPAPAVWEVPVHGERLRGDALAAHIDDWQRRGIIEPGAAQALHRCRMNPQWFDLSDRTMVLLGAGSQAGPLAWLARWRANIVAVDVTRPEVWQRIVATVEQGNGRLIAPVMHPVPDGTPAEQWIGAAGADLLTDAVAVSAWLSTLPGPLDVGALAYLDGERHVRVSIAMDMVQQVACAAHPHTTLAWMATPTDVFAVPEATARRAMQAFEHRSLLSRTLQGPVRLASGDRLFHANVSHLVSGDGGGPAWGLVDSLVVEQGPNYALAKRLQQWRAVVARAEGRRTSLNVAPSTTTASVLKNPALAAGFAGAEHFGLEVFAPETTNALMAALWVHDLRCEEAAANPRRPLAHPFELFMANACHGGLWTGAYRARSALPLAAALGWVEQRLGTRP